MNIDSEILLEFNIDRLRLVENGLTILLGWSILNLLISSVFYWRAKSVIKQVLLMNFAWNLVNLALAVVGLYNAASPDSLDFTQTITAQNHLEKVLIFNTGLDFGYLLLGFLLIEKSKSMSQKVERLKGFGLSILIQGAYLLIFDLTFFVLLNKQGQILLDIISQ